jgi:DNA polymerase III epsilon subunit-like protein
MGTIKGKPRGYFEKFLAIDCETSGLKYNSDDPSDGFQSVSWGVIVADAKTLKPIEELYVEIKWNGESEWAMGAQRIHGLSKEHLEENGMTEEEAVVAIGSVITKHFGTNALCLLGHNVATFDLWFLKRLFRKFGIELKFGNRHVDTSSIGFVNWEVFTSDALFEEVGYDARGAHNALDDARMALEAARRTRVLFKTVLE